MKRLPIPDQYQNDPDYLEILAVWVKPRQAMSIFLAPDSFKDPEIWGYVVSDVANDIANAVQQMRKCDKAERDEILRKIVQVFNEEVFKAQDKKIGKLLRPM